MRTTNAHSPMTNRPNGRLAPALLLAVAGLLLGSTALAQPADMPPVEDKTLSPYFFVQSDDPALDRMPLLSTSAVVDIAGVIADVKVTQVYKNDGRRPIEAIYTFPASTRAAVYALKMTIGDRTIVARIREREQARADYEQAKADGKSATLLEQERPNVFQMNVANIMPGDLIKVEMSYTELLVPDAGVYEFAYPTVVGPRYNNKTKAESPQSDNWIKSPFTHAGDAPSYTFNISVNLLAGMPVQEMSCPSHKTKMTWRGARRRNRAATETSSCATGWPAARSSPGCCSTTAAFRWATKFCPATRRARTSSC
jgi:Ca-activated chloride channel homolog